jgi:hypothetical protein
MVDKIGKADAEKQFNEHFLPIIQVKRLSIINVSFLFKFYGRNKKNYGKFINAKFDLSLAKCYKLGISVDKEDLKHYLYIFILIIWYNHTYIFCVLF